MPTTRGPGQRAGLTRTAVLTAARELLAEGGVPALSMRGVAGRLGVAPNALYSHVPNKAALLDDLLDDLLALVAAPSPDVADPVAGLAEMMSDTYDVLTAHGDLVPVYLARQGARGVNAVRLGQLMDTLLTRAGVTGQHGDEARRVLIVHTIGAAAFATAPTADSDPPLSTKHARRSYTLGLHWLLDGISRSRIRSPPSVPD